jgi:hypothetical protein
MIISPKYGKKTPILGVDAWSKSPSPSPKFECLVIVSLNFRGKWLIVGLI